MDEAKHKAAILGDLARLKSTWGKVQASIAQEKEEAERARQRATEEANRQAREAELFKAKQRDLVESAVMRVMNECGPGFKRVDISERDPALVRIVYEPTEDELWVSERMNNVFLISVMRRDRQSFSQDTQFTALFTEEAIMSICMELLLNANRKHVPPMTEGRIL